jgi:hypothetical protein
LTALENLLAGIEAPIIYSEHLVGDGQEMFEHAARLNWEGIISKNADAPYRSDRNEAWLKIKTVQQGTFPVIGFMKDPTGVAALYLGKREGDDLVYMGKVGTGWSRTMSSQIRKQLDTVVSPKSKLTKPIREPKATWVEPSFMAEVEFRDTTSDGLLPTKLVQGSLEGNAAHLAARTESANVAPNRGQFMQAGGRELRCNALRRRVLLAVHRATDLGCSYYFKSGVRTWQWVRLSGSTRLKDTVSSSPMAAARTCLSISPRWKRPALAASLRAPR